MYYDYSFSAVRPEVSTRDNLEILFIWLVHLRDDSQWFKTLV